MSQKRPSTETEAVNPDSFLDIVASVVSIMIIMVMMIGLRIKHTPVDVSLAIAHSREGTELKKDVAIEHSLRADVLRTANEIRTIQQEGLVRQQDRDLLAVAVSAMEQKIQTGRQQLDTDNQQDFDLARSLSEAKTHLEDLQRRRIAAETAPSAPVVIESYPTPISRVIDGHEIHFQLEGGRLTYIPMDALLERFKADARRKAYRLMDQQEMTDTVGPENGWRMRYTLRRVDMTPELARQTGRSGSFAKVVLCTLIPTSSQLGETIDEALAEGSDFRKALAQCRPGTAVTVWVYPDSFPAFRQVRKELYRLGFPIAARPLPSGKPIGLSPEGSKSSAE